MGGRVGKGACPRIPGRVLMASVLQWVARPVRRVMRSLTGSYILEGQLSQLDGKFSQLQGQLSQIQADISRFAGDAAERANAVQSTAHTIEQAVGHTLQRGDAMLSSIAEAQRSLAAIQPTVSSEIERLDRYLVHHAERIIAQLAMRSDGIVQRLDVLPVYSAPSVHAAISLGVFDLIVPSNETGLLRFLMRHGMEGVEPAVRAVLRRHLRPGMVSVDGGANVGVHTLIMADAVGPKGRVLAFEPLPHMATALHRSLMLNGLSDRVQVVKAALVQEPGEILINVADHSPISSLFPPVGIATTAMSVAGRTLDGEIPKGGRVDLVKLDIEGAEPLAWQGMQRVLAENPAIIVIMEWSASHFSRSGINADHFMAAVQSAGFMPWLLDDARPDEPQPLEASCISQLEATNVLFTRVMRH
jgi:FkbM family methyltransferase